MSITCIICLDGLQTACRSPSDKIVQTHFVSFPQHQLSTVRPDHNFIVGEYVCRFSLSRNTVPDNENSNDGLRLRSLIPLLVYLVYSHESLGHVDQIGHFAGLIDWKIIRVRDLVRKHTVCVELAFVACQFEICLCMGVRISYFVTFRRHCVVTLFVRHRQA